MSPRPSQLVAIIASLALVGCSSIGTINGQRLEVGATPQQVDASPPALRGYICEDMEFLCIVGIGGLIALLVVAATVHTSTPPGQ
jgi:hypothetical protein